MVKIMYTISENVKNEIIIKNSRFITIIAKIKTKEEAISILNQVKKTILKQRIIVILTK